MKIRPITVFAAILGIWVAVWVVFEIFPPKDKPSAGAPGTPVAAATVAAAAPDFPLKKEDLKVGNGAEAVPGKTVQVHYTGTLTDGTKFDSSRDRNEPYEFVLGAGNVIKGWDEGIKGMREGGHRKLTVPPKLGYGADDAPGGKIPPNSILVFDLELVKVK